MNKNFGLLLKGLALAMGLALIVMAILGSASSRTGGLLAGIGIFAIALESFLKYAYGVHK